MGKFVTGFKDAKFIDSVQSSPDLTYDTNNLVHGGGYTPQFQSVPITQYDMFAVATTETDATDTSATNFYYDWVWIESIGTDGKVTVQVRLAANKNTKGR